MSAIVWPASLPCNFVDGGGPETRLAPKDAFEPDEGPPISRPAGTVTLYEWPVEAIMTHAQFATFEAFFDSDLARGTLPFWMNHPRRGTTVKCRIPATDAYSATRFGAKLRVSMTLLVQL